MGSTWGPSGANRTQVGLMLAPWTLLSGWLHLSLGLSNFSLNKFWCNYIWPQRVWFKFSSSDLCILLLDAQLIYGNKYPWKLWDYKVVFYVHVNTKVKHVYHVKKCIFSCMNWPWLWIYWYLHLPRFMLHVPNICWLNYTKKETLNAKQYENPVTSSINAIVCWFPIHTLRT